MRTHFHFSTSQRCGNIRVDTHRDNKVMQHILTKQGFQRCGIIYVKNGTERIAYQVYLPPSMSVEGK